MLSISSDQYCDSCRRKFTNLPLKCLCNKQFYCSSDCQEKIIDEHALQCDLAIKVEEPSFIKSKESRNGIVGLKNLGNTCYMNVTLQSLSNCETLTNFFISKQYLKELNLQNPLGSQGQLAKQYASLIDNLWIQAKSEFSPVKMKSTIGKMNLIFNGSQQHDTCEFLTYILDGIHEDLNRVKNKTQIQTVESNGRSDDEVSQESWENHLKRNQSIIVDNFHGQFKSRIKCLQCNINSNCFDTFMIYSLSIPFFNITYLNSHLTSKQIEINYSNIQNQNINYLKNNLSKILNISPNRLVIYLNNPNAQILNDQDLIHQEKQNQNFICIQLDDQDISIHQDDLIIINLKIYTNEDKKLLSCIRPIFLEKSMNLEQFHYKIQNYFKFNHFLFRIRQNNFDRKPFQILMHDKIKNSYEEVPLDQYQSLQIFLQKNQQPEIHVQMNNSHFIRIWKNQKSQNQQIFNENKNEQKELEKDISLETCLNFNKQPYLLEKGNEWYCPQCKEHVSAEMILQIYIPPKILILQLKRFRINNQIKKNKQFISFPIENLDLTDHIISGQKNQYIYDLIAVCNHYGNMGSGHYTCFALNDKQWFCYDDTNVIKINKNQIITNQAYVLFYKLRD